MRACLFLIIALCLSPAYATSTEQKISPYLAAHANDLVHWNNWDQTTLQRAQTENRLILVSSGYLACRYCYVMKQESFENVEIADYINSHFVPILIDSEMEPVLDAQLQRFMEAMEQPQGWPLQVILTPRRDPLVGVVYQPPENFLSFLKRVQARWQEDPERMTDVAHNATRAIIRELSTQAFRIDERLAAGFEEALIQQTFLVADNENGGFGDSEKYPMAPQMLALIELSAMNADPPLKRFLIKSLDVMASGGLYDAVNGGFFRYTTARDWRFPHFEKMLDINALLADLYLQAALALNRTDYPGITKNTLDMLIRDFTLPNGGFANSLSAVDSTGRDGGAYLWKESALEKLLQPGEFELATKNWHKIESTTETEYLPITSSFDLTASATQEKIFTRLRNIRKANKPVRDEKIVTASHALLLKAFSNYAAHDPYPIYRKTATTLFNLVKQKLWTGKKLQHSNLGGDANLADYSYLADACLVYSQLTQDAEAMQLSEILTHLAWQKFYIDGFWRQMEQLDALMPYTVYPVMLQDTQLPSASATLIRVTLALGENRLANEYQLAKQAQRTADTNMAESPFFYATQILGLAREHGKHKSN